MPTFYEMRGIILHRNDCSKDRSRSDFLSQLNLRLEETIDWRRIADLQMSGTLARVFDDILSGFDRRPAADHVQFRHHVETAIDVGLHSDL